MADDAIGEATPSASPKLPTQTPAPQSQSPRFALRRRWRLDDERGPVAPRWSAILGAAMVAGVLAGFLELGVFLFQRDVLHQVGLKTQFLNRHGVWMIPAAEFLGVVALALALGLPLRLLPARQARQALLWLLATLVFLGPILAIRGLFGWAAFLLAAGVGLRAARMVGDRPARSLRWACPAAVLLLVGHGLFHWDRLAHGEARSWQTAAPPPEGTANLLWIVLDTVRADHLSLYGYERETTPNLDRWAARGVAFEQARSAAPWTLPSHMTMLTGLWPFEHRVRIDRPYTGASPLLAEHLRDRGFATAGFVSNTGCVNACFGFDRGFSTYVDHRINQEISPYTVAKSSALGQRLVQLGNRWLRLGIDRPQEGHKRAPELLAMAREWQDRRAAGAPGRPYFLFLNLMDAHGPYRPPADFPRAYWTGPLPASPVGYTPKLGYDAQAALAAAGPAERAERQANVDAAARQLNDLYDDCIRALDARLGAYLDDMDARGELDRTWVVITSDHGEHFGDHDRFGHGNSLYNELVHVPLLLIPPRQLGADDPAAAARGARIGRVASLRDLPATVSGLLMPGTPHPFPGTSLARHWADPSGATDDDEPLLAQLEKQPIDSPEAVDGGGVRTTDALFARDRTYIRQQADEDVEEQLFELRGDPHQARDIRRETAEQGALEGLRAMWRQLVSPPVARR